MAIMRKNNDREREEMIHKQADQIEELGRTMREKTA